MFRNATALAVLLAATATVASAAPPVYASAADAFVAAVATCEDVFAGSAAGLKSEPGTPGPLKQRGFEPVGDADQSKWRLLAPSSGALVAQAPIRVAGEGQVFIAISDTKALCNVGVFDAIGSEQTLINRLDQPSSGWLSPSTPASRASINTREYVKLVGHWPLSLKVHWPAGGKVGRQSIAAMAVMRVVRDED